MAAGTGVMAAATRGLSESAYCSEGATKVLFPESKGRDHAKTNRADDGAVARDANGSTADRLQIVRRLRSEAKSLMQRAAASASSTVTTSRRPPVVLSSRASPPRTITAHPPRMCR